jgi:hypothetical protein
MNPFDLDKISETAFFTAASNFKWLSGKTSIKAISRIMAELYRGQGIGKGLDLSRPSQAKLIQLF